MIPLVNWLTLATHEMHHRDVARLPYIAPDSEVADRIRQRRSGTLTPLDAMLLHSPAFADGWYRLLGTVRNRCTLPPDVREAVILRIAVLNDASYEWAAHESPAREAGLSTGDLEAIRSGAGLPGAVGAALRYTDAMTREVAVPDAVFAEIRDVFDDQRILELTVTIAGYNMVSRLLVALQVRAGDEVPPAIVL
jgi:4-carboxymuconolactone decarboxylase